MVLNMTTRRLESFDPPSGAFDQLTCIGFRVQRPTERTLCIQIPERFRELSRVLYRAEISCLTRCKSPRQVVHQAVTTFGHFVDVQRKDEDRISPSELLKIRQHLGE